MGTERESSGDYLNQPLSIEEQNERELQHARWHAAAMLDRVAAAAKASAEAAARVAQLEAVFAQAKRDREAHAQEIDRGAIFPHAVAD